jgi:hypothetical protein
MGAAEPAASADRATPGQRRPWKNAMANRDVLAIGTSGRRENTDKAREFEREMDIIRASIRRTHRLAAADQGKDAAK